MTTDTTTALRKTALHSVHRAAGAKMVSFGGWDMPVEYSGIIQEHLAVRTACGLFDVSHMGEIEIRGREALALVQWVTSNDASKLVLGQAQYSGLLTDRGTFVDDIIVHKFSDTHYFLCVNAANREKDFEYIRSQNRFDAEVIDSGDSYTQLALQGPKAQTILQLLTPVDLNSIKYYRFTFGQVLGVDCLIARTGYTGEDGFELYFEPAQSEKMWHGLLEAGKPHGLIPAGLGARNTLRLEAGFALYGHEIDDTTTVWEANLGWICKMDKGEFIARAALAAQKERGLERKLVGFEMRGRGIARDGYPVFVNGGEAGRVTSGSPAPFLQKNIGMAYVPVAASAPGTPIEIGIRDQRVPAEIVPLPFYKRPRG
ncbi:MAG TPA: glycine cleavage system aminomethyltransferase GcvT [Candidatus Xenobia bacterium]|nr:glycine cleavage system aminomethyltransferase GcvT [Candidatus Xenobia bacterium]